MAKKTTVETLVSALAHFNIKRIGRRDLKTIIEDEFAYFPLNGERFVFVLIHDGSPEWFVKDFNAMINTFAFKEDAYEQDVKKALYEARNALWDIAGD